MMVVMMVVVMVGWYEGEVGLCGVGWCGVACGVITLAAEAVS